MAHRLLGKPPRSKKKQGRHNKKKSFMELKKLKRVAEQDAERIEYEKTYRTN